MAVVAVTDSNLRREDMEGAFAGVGIGGGPGGVVEPDFFYQGAQAWSRKVGSTTRTGWYQIVGVTTDMTAAGNEVVMLKSQVTNKEALHANGFAHRIGSDTAAYYEYIIADDGTFEAVVGAKPGDRRYVVKGGWLITPIDPSVVAWRNSQTGAPAITAIDYFSITAAFGATSRSPNLIMDAIDIGPGLFLVGGDGADPDGTWADFVGDDEGTIVAGRFGHLATLEGIIYAFGRFVIGRTAGATVTATVFQGELETIVFPGGWVDAAWNAIEVDLGNATTDVDLVSTTFIGRGRDNLRRWFDSQTEVDAVNDEIDIVAHGYFTGEAVDYSDEGGTQITGLIDGNEYFVRAVTLDAFSLHDTRADAYADTAVRNLVAGLGETHSFRRRPDTRPDFDVVGTVGDLLVDGCTFVAFRELTLTSAAEFLGCKLVGCTFLNLGSGLLTDCVIDAPLVAQGEAFVLASTLANIVGNKFTMGEVGHAIEIDTPGTYTLSTNEFVGYGPAAVEFHTTNDVDGPNDELDLTAHPYATGDEVWYSDEGGVQNIGLTDQTRYFVRSIDADSISLFVTKEDAESDVNTVDLTAGGAETHALYSANAVLLNSSGGAVTVNVSNGIGTVSVRNTAGSTTTVNNTVDHVLTGLVNTSEVTYVTAGTNNELFHVESVAGGSTTYSYEGAKTVDIMIAHNDYVWLILEGVVLTGTEDASIPITQQTDPVYKNP